MKAPESSVVLRRYLRHGTFPQLVTLEAVMRPGSARAAAETLCRALSTPSGRLHRLGDALQVTLFDARGGHAVPTPAAVAVLETGHEIFAAPQRCELRLDDCRAAQPAAGLQHHRAALPAGITASRQDDRPGGPGCATIRLPACAGSGDRPAFRQQAHQ